MANETRLIDANALDNQLSKLMIRFHAMGRDKVVEDYNFVRTVLETAPTVDAVEVVRCKDCKQWGGVAFGNVCRRWSAPLAGMKNCTGPDDFCSYGEKKK